MKTIVFEDCGSFLRGVVSSYQKLLTWLKSKGLTSKTLPNTESITLIYRADVSDYQLYGSRHTRVGNIFDGDLKWCDIWPSGLTEKYVRLSLFLGLRLEAYSRVSISGYFVESGSKQKHAFNIELVEADLVSINRPSYWLDLKIVLPASLYRVKDRVTGYIRSVKVNRRQKELLLKRILYQPVKKSGSKTKIPLVVVLSMDGISACDIEDGDLAGFRAFEKEAIVFRKAVCSSSVTGSAAGCLMTGLGLSRHYMYDYDQSHYSDDLNVLSPNIYALQDLAHQKGFRCVGLTVFSKWRPQFGYSRGFDEYLNVSTGRVQYFPYQSEAVRLMSAASQKEPIFALLHLPGAHPPFSPFFTNEVGVNTYHETIRAADRLLSSMIGWMKEVGLWNEAIVCLASDHGCSREPYKRTGYQFDDQRLFVPMMIKLPKENEAYKLWQKRMDDYVSATTSVFEVVASAIDAQLPEYYVKASERTYGNVSWLNETVDYASQKRLGIVGYGLGYKWVAYMHFDKENLTIGAIESLAAYKISSDGVLSGKEDLLASIELRQVAKVKASLNSYIKQGAEFSKGRKPIRQKEVRSSMQINNMSGGL